MAKDIIHILEAVGFTDEQAQLYTRGLQMGTAPASEYAKATGLNRITSYNLLENLVRQGYFTVIRKVRSKWYAPIAPEYIAVEARKNVEALERALPELRSLQAAKYRKPRVRFFEGWEGIRHVYSDTLTAQTEILNFANSALVRTYWPGYDDEYVAERVKRGIRLRGIAPDDAAGRRVHGEDRRRLREIRLVPAKDFDFRNEINIYDHKVAICSFDSGLKGNRDMFGVIMESKEVAETQKQIFEMAWRYAGMRRPKKRMTW
ncbi:MAG: transcriptional regulator TrmB [Candidatus Peregrinibacteria bacterium Gr01-1014_25]|nr:MAG: transcriptional regulator TrmB [Candidatus Peregrinibacteria bacterium Gr01-1014_25]